MAYSDRAWGPAIDGRMPAVVPAGRQTGRRGEAQLAASVADLHSAFPGLHVVREADGFHIAAEGERGFPVRIAMSGTSCTVWMGECSQDFDDIETAKWCVSLAICAASRLRVERQGDRVRRWWLESADGAGGWQSCLGGGAGMGLGLALLLGSRQRLETVHQNQRAAPSERLGRTLAAEH